MHSQYSSRTADKFVVRLPDGMRERVAEVAKENHRSMNSEIISRLEQSLLADAPNDGTLGLRIDSPEVSKQEQELLKHFRQLAKRQQNAMLALITVDVEAP